MKYLKRNENNLQYHDFEQFSGILYDLEKLLELHSHTITEITDFMFDSEEEGKYYQKKPRAFQVTYPTMHGDERFTIVQGDYISTKNGIKVIKKHEFEKDFVPSKYELLRLELFDQLEIYKQSIKHLEKRIEDAEEGNPWIERMKQDKQYTEGVHELLRRAIQKIRIIKTEV